MKLIAIDTSSVACSTALQLGDEIIERHEERPREHTRILLPMIRELLEDGGITLGELALYANPTRGAVKPGTEPGLEATNYFGPERGATASGIHAMIVEIDPDTYDVRIEKLVVVHDCGHVDRQWTALSGVLGRGLECHPQRRKARE